MGWLKKSVMDQKKLFIDLWQSNDYTMTTLCKKFRISRPTGYKLVYDFQDFGEDAYYDLSRAPINTPHKTDSRIENHIIKLRKKYPNWGARKLKVLMERRFPKSNIPSETTVNAILKRNGLINSRKRRYKKQEKLYPQFDPAQPNHIWSADYKGKFKIGNKRYCYPLTVCDSNSRFILDIDCHYNPTYKAVKQAYTSIFRLHGMPKYIHTDNGTPFGSIQSPKRFSKLCYWLIDHGVTPLFSDPGCPQQNGRHERMHRDLKAFCKHKIKHTLTKQQKVLDDFKYEYNHIRPHESLDLNTPSSIHSTSIKHFNGKTEPFEYPLHFKVFKVTTNGAARWGAYHWLNVSRSARGRYVGAEEIGNGVWNLFYRNVLLGSFNTKTLNGKQSYMNLNRINV